jgi:hypothetical protein
MANLDVYTSLLTPAVQEFIRAHEHADERQLVLKHKEIAGVSAARVAEQIAARRKAKDKLPVYYQTEGIVYPPTVNLEQSSSEETARYKQVLLKQEGVPLGVAADLTEGFGIDTFFLSQAFQQVHAVEPNDSLQAIARHNHGRLGANNVHYHNITAEKFLDEDNAVFDFIYIDPSRRAGTQKVFKLSDCVPDVAALQDRIFAKANDLLIKASPLLDVQQGLKEISCVKTVYVVAVNNECKELLFFCRRGYIDAPSIVAVNLKQDVPETFSFSLREEQQARVTETLPASYLYEPNAAVLKAGAFKLLVSRYGVSKIQVNTHLYTSETFVGDFPGRVFKVEAFVKSDAKAVLPFFPDGQANVVTRNYPLAAEALKKKVGLRDGGDKYLLGFSGTTGKFLVVAVRMK